MESKLKALSGREGELLAILLRKSHGAHGAELVRDYEEQHRSGLSHGAVYVLMDRLEQKGLVSSSWGEPTTNRGGRRKRIYIAKPEGRLVLAGQNSMMTPRPFGLAVGVAS